MQYKKIIASLGVLVCLFTNSNVAAYADTAVPFVSEVISPAYEIACNPISDLYIEDRTAYCTSAVSGTEAVSITVTQTLQKHWGLWIWNDVEDAEWTKTEKRNCIRLDSTKQGLGKGRYRVQSIFVLINANGKSEKITVYSNEQVVP